MRILQTIPHFVGREALSLFLADFQSKRATPFDLLEDSYAPKIIKRNRIYQRLWSGREDQCSVVSIQTSRPPLRSSPKNRIPSSF